MQAHTRLREIERHTRVDRKTVRRNTRAAKSPALATGSQPELAQTPPLRPPAPAASAVSACAAHREWIEAQLQLGRNATSIHQDLVEHHRFTHAYNSVKRFVAKVRAREPERFDVLEFLPGEEAQVDWAGAHPRCISRAAKSDRGCSS